MSNLSVWQIIAWSCCAGPVVLCLVVGLVAVFLGGVAEIIHGHPPASKDDNEPDSDPAP